MSVTLDDYISFEEQQFEIETGCFSRDSIEKAVPGLDGVLSIDLGLRGRKIKQKGILQAKSRSHMNNRIKEISSYLDGKTHTLRTGSEELENLRMDSFKVSKQRTDSSGIIIDYEIVYTQLV